MLSNTIGQSEDTLDPRDADVEQQIEEELNKQIFVGDTSNLTQVQRADVYSKNSPRTRQTKFVIEKGNERFFRAQSLEVPMRENKTLTTTGAETLNNPLKDYSNQTFVHSIKTRDIIKNGFGMNYQKNKAFLPVNNSDAKKTIHRPTVHNEEMYDFSLGRSSVKKKIRDKFNITG